MPACSQTRSDLQALIGDLRAQAAGGDMVEGPSSLTDRELLSELRSRMDSLVNGLSHRDAELARTLVSLLMHFNRLAPGRPIEASSPRAISWGTATADPYSTLRRHVSDFQLGRSHTSSNANEVTSGLLSPVQAVETALVWSEIDSELETVLSICRAHAFEDPFADNLPPEYDAADYALDGLPHYDTLDGKLDTSTRSMHKAGSILDGSSTRLHESTNEKMRMDLEAVTLAIDRLYSAAPQLHNQRVELNTTKLQEMERAKRKGKQKETDRDAESRELDRMVELIGKASERKLMNQSVFIDETLRRKMETAKQKDHEKVRTQLLQTVYMWRRLRCSTRAQRAAFVDQLANHSEAGRMHAQDASFLPPRSQSQPALVENMLDPHALLTLPEFIREGVPEAVQQRMELQRDPEALLSLPEFIREHPIPSQAIQAHNRRQSISQTSYGDDGDGVVANAVSRRVSKGNRARSMSEPLAWLLSPRSSSPAIGSSLGLGRRSSRKSTRPNSSHGSTPDFEGEYRLKSLLQH